MWGKSNMQIRNKLFPYPILNKNSVLSNYKDKKFELVYEDKSNTDELIISNITYATDSGVLLELIEKDLVKVALIVECADTIYREIFDITHAPLYFSKSKQEFNGEIEISMYAYANKNFVKRFEEVDDDYCEIDFELEKYDILAINDGISLSIIHTDAEDSLAKSIFSIQHLDNIEEGIFAVELERKKIVICMSEYDYNNYKIVYSMPLFQEVFFNIFLVPALIQALSSCFAEIKNGIKCIDDIMTEFYWFSSIEKQYNRLTGKKIMEDTIEDLVPVQLAQLLLGCPLKSALDKMIGSTKDKYSEEE